MKQIAKVEVVRMNALATMLDDVQENNFDLDHWCTREEEPAEYRFFGLIESKPACGFAGCAIGWAIHTKLIPNLKWKYGSPAYAASADGETYNGFYAVAEAFGITPRMAEFLFLAERYKVRATTEMVASRIRRLVAKVEAIRARDRKKAVDDFVKSVNAFTPLLETAR
jgi:hypothetical protein